MNVISKMRVMSVEDYGFSRRVKFSCVYDNGINTGDSAENVSFTKATPSGEAWMTIDNKAVWPAFRLPRGEGSDFTRESEHYVVFIDAGEHSLEDVYRALDTLNNK